MTGADRHLSTPIDTNFPFSYQLDSLSFHINQANHMQIICKSYANHMQMTSGVISDKIMESTCQCVAHQSAIHINQP